MCDLLLIVSNYAAFCSHPRKIECKHVAMSVVYSTILVFPYRHIQVHSNLIKYAQSVQFKLLLNVKLKHCMVYYRDTYSNGKYIVSKIVCMYVSPLFAAHYRRREHGTIYQANFNTRCVGSQGPMRPATFTRHDKNISQPTSTQQPSQYRP